MSELQHEIARRRTFAIISHPDAGKTTLTEKLLLYGGALRLAGSVTARRNMRKATSDWMELEQQRGISVTSTVLQFEYEDHTINLLDTPGHEDFSEDTYRTLTAADSAVMLIDSAKGIEPQTRKLFEVCRIRRIPIFTFINKLDRPGRPALELLDELEGEFGIAPWPVNWPIGSGPTFSGVYDRLHHRAHLYERTAHGAYRAPVELTDLNDPKLAGMIGQRELSELRDDLELIGGAGVEYSHERFLTGEISPTFFGSAVNNFGVDLFLERFVSLAPPPAPRRTANGPLDPASETFTGFVFKIQANMDRQHRDRVAFLRVCSGKFERDMSVTNTRSGRQVRLSRPHKLFAQERETVEEAYPGDIIGLMNPGVFAIGDTVTSGKGVQFEPIPHFSPERFASVRTPSPAKRKSLQKGLEQLREEGAIQVMYSPNSTDPILAAVGQLQFDVVKFRLEAEYGVDVILAPLPFVAARWLFGSEEDLGNLVLYSGTVVVNDADNLPVMLFQSEWHINAAQEKNPKVTFSPVVRGEAVPV
ncbi:MAG: peptide chain release factor 3 [Candidatus Kapabacteria bacterium]|nr:MAG: elongation factor EF-G [Chlorobi bacterium OLB7]MBX7216470.1 peptide chain release factor 3 [Candidatus Kapabacteria bacterium]